MPTRRGIFDDKINDNDIETYREIEQNGGRIEKRICRKATDIDWLSAHEWPGLNTAVVYAKNQREYLERYLEDGRLEISNNRAERSIKPFVIGRKNWLFANTLRGAKASAILFSIIETAKETGLNPYEYLTYVFINAPNWDIRNRMDNLERLLPWFVPNFCKAQH